MCMTILKNLNGARIPKPDKDGFCVGWKVLGKNNNTPFNWVGMEYKIGENVSNRKSAELTPYENDGLINEGLHLCLKREVARKIKSLFTKSLIPTKIVKVYYKPEDVVAYGEGKEVVVHKLTIKSLNGVG